MLFLFFFILSPFLFADHAHFLPPDGWEMARPKDPVPYVQVGFIGKGTTDFRPSVSFATEEVDATLKEYIKAVKEIHLSERKQYRDLGKFSMKGGEGRLIELTEKNAWGVIKILQAILIKGNWAYLLTGSVLKEDFPRFQQELLACFRTLEVIPDLWTPIANLKKREEFQALYANLGSGEKSQEWKNLQKEVKNFSDLGSYWQFLALEEGHAKIFPPQE